MEKGQLELCTKTGCIPGDKFNYVRNYRIKYSSAERFRSGKFFKCPSMCKTLYENVYLIEEEVFTQDLMISVFVISIFVLFCGIQCWRSRIIFFKKEAKVSSKQRYLPSVISTDRLL